MRQDINFERFHGWHRISLISIDFLPLPFSSLREGYEMAEIDPYDDSIIRFAITRHNYDPETKHFRWIYESAYDNKREFKKRFEQVSNDLEARQLSGLAHSKENVSGKRLEVGYFQNSQVRREARHAQGAYREVDWKLRFVLVLEKVRRFIPFRFRRR